MQGVREVSMCYFSRLQMKMLVATVITCLSGGTSASAAPTPLPRVSIHGSLEQGNEILFVRASCHTLWGLTWASGAVLSCTAPTLRPLARYHRGFIAGLVAE